MITNVKLDESNPATKTILVGVYGTLKQGYGAHGMMNGEFKGNFILPEFQMHHLGGFPGIVPSSEKSRNVELEVYELMASSIHRLDSYEGVPSLYRRYSGESEIGTIYFYVFNHDTESYPVIARW